jgi:hypothetical protein
MKYPTLAELNTSREWLDVFAGYNHNLRIGEGEFYEMKNLSSDNYPILSPRSPRGIYVSNPTKPEGLVAKDALCYTDGSKLIINKNPVEIGLKEIKDKYTGDIIPKTLISMGAYIIIMPDRKYINTLDYTDNGLIDATVTTSGTVTFSLCKVDGVAYENPVAQATAPEDTNELWIDTSSTPHSLKQYNTTTDMWTTIATTYIKIYCQGSNIGKSFEVNDGVTISGVESKALADLNASMIILAKGDDYIVVTGILDKVTTQTKPLTVERRMPDMDFIVESGNRLWGCRYGRQGDQIVNEIYASKLGDFKNWQCYAGISTDSYAASVGTDGEFTGAITHLGYPIFFKENFMHKVYGNYPANYQIQTTACRGVQKGCGKSLAIVNEVLYYKARSGICAYDGSLPTEISSALGDISYSNAVAGTLGNKYYVSMCDADGKYHLFVYDTLKRMWHREDNTEVTYFCNCRGDLYFIDNGDEFGQVQIKNVKGTGVKNKETKPIEWEAVTGIIGTDSPDKKYISRLDVRMKLVEGARVTFLAEYDSSGEWEYLFTMDGIKLKSFAVPIKPQRCDHLRLRIIGVGDAKIYSICKTIEWGSDV